ncbi:MAG: hypothetical protein ACL7BU_05055 [Candidatus Phlomobacter fragariae]
MLNKDCSLRQQIISTVGKRISKYGNQAKIYALTFGEHGLLEPILKQQLQRTGMRI